MNGIQSAIHLIDRATPQQLVGMVGDPSNPYRAIALAKLQEFRDMKMKAAASAPTAPPLAQTIPAQVMAPAQPQMPPQMAQMPTQMPMQMPQQPLDQGIGGIGPTVSAAAGGSVKRFSGDGEQLVKMDAGLMGNEIGGALDETPPKPLPTSAQVDEIIATLRAKGKSVGLADVRDIQAGKYPIVSAPARVAPSAGPPAGYADPSALAVAENARVRVAPAAPAAFRPAASSPDQSGIGVFKQPGLQSRDAASRLADKGFGELKAAQQGVYDTRKAHLFDADKSKKEYAAAQMTDEQSDAYRKAQFERINKEMPDPTKRIQEQLDTMKGENAKDAANAPYQGLLKLGLSMLGTKNSNFMQALGEGGAAGLTEYNTAIGAVKARKTALLSADATLAQAQDARSRGMYDRADKLLAESKQQRINSFIFGKEAEAAAAKSAIELAGVKEGMARTDIDQSKVRLDIITAANADVIKIATLSLQGQSNQNQARANEIAMMQPSAKTIEYINKNPDNFKQLNNLEERSQYLHFAEILHKDFTARYAAWVKEGRVGVEPTDKDIAAKAKEMVAAQIPLMGPRVAGNVGEIK